VASFIGKPWIWIWGALLFLAVCPARAEVLFGKVVDATGSPLPGVLVENESANERALTGTDGDFSLPEAPLPVTLRFSLDGYGEGEIEVSSESEIPVTIRLAIHAVEGENISVSAEASVRPLVPASLASTTLRADSSAGSPSSLASLAVQSPAVSENGQGGLFQVISVRGVSRQRLRTFVGDVPITSERRAGAAASFVDSELLGALEVVRGPVSSAYGSGALGGVIQANLRAYDGFSLVTGIESQGKTRFASAGWGSGEDDWGGGVAVRRADSGEDGEGAGLNNGFTQASAFISREWEGVSLLALGSSATDIGKPNTDFPQRTTIYPSEKHLLLRLGLETPKGWEMKLFAHSSSLDTRTSRDTGAVAEVESETLDLGFTAHREIGRLRLGIDYFGRHGVNVRERQTAPGADDEEFRTLRGAREEELGLVASSSWTWGPARFEGGGRWIWHRQGNDGSGSEPSAEITDNEPSAFIGVILPVKGGFEILANAGTGLRFPSLSERFFSGTTGRGQTVANANLEPETAETLDLGARWFGARTAVSVFAYRTRIEGFIERVEIEPDVLTFENLVSGTLEGVEVEALLRISQQLRLTAGGHWTEGRDSSGNSLEDVPPHRVQVAANLLKGVWDGRVSAQYRFRKRDIGSGEKEIDDAFLLDFSLTRKLPRGLALSLVGDNLLDTVYHPSADRKASLAPGRSWGLRLSWQL